MAKQKEPTILSLGSKGDAYITSLNNNLANRGLLKKAVDDSFDFITLKAVLEFQGMAGLTKDGLVQIAPTFGETWRALMHPPANKLEYLVIHCSATPENLDVRPEQVRQWHKAQGWNRPGYSEFITLDGEIHKMWEYDEDDYVADWELTNGVWGFNQVCRHICYAGGIDLKGNAVDTRTEPQIETMKKYALDFVEKHTKAKVSGHHQFQWNNKNCPCFSVPKWAKEIGIEDKNILKSDPFGYVKFYETGKW
ncbi:MAG: N-acetylmuramoyl-L-alanine amidase [Planktothrix sp.]